MMPVVAAMIVPIRVTERARPPGMRRVSTCSACRRSWATPERSSIVPMKVNIGMATRTGFSIVPPKMRFGSTFIRAQFMAPRKSPSTAKPRPMPPRMKATG